MTVTRFAPSPTGYLHIGGLRTALFSYLWARKNEGKFYLRIEDTDMARNSEDAVRAILEAFNWVGMDYDGEALFQSKRFDIYKTYIQKLLDEGKAYHCYMSKEELDELRAWQSANKQKPGYDRRWRDSDMTPPEGVSPVVRIKAPLDGEIVFDDGVKGAIRVGAVELDDFIIARADGSPTYNFVVAVDDALMGVTDVIRGDDHTSNTPKQIVVYEALGFDIPKFYHVPMILGSDGSKLSKRHGAADVMEYKQEGYLPEALLNFLVRLGWSNGDTEIFSMEDMLELFDPKDINRSASQYNLEKLNWLNGHYLKNLKRADVMHLLKDFSCDAGSHPKADLLLTICEDRVKSLVELAESINSIVNAPSSYDEKAVEKNINDEAKKILADFAAELHGCTEELDTPEQFKTFVEGFLAKEGHKMPKLGLPLRIALVGTAQAPSIFELLSVIGKEEVLRRVDSFLKVV